MISRVPSILDLDDLEDEIWALQIDNIYIRFSEKAMAPHSSTLAWKIPWTEEPGGLQSVGSLRVRHDWATSLSLFTFMHWRGKWQPNPVFLPGESQGRGAWWASVYGVTQSRTRVKWLSSSSTWDFGLRVGAVEISGDIGMEWVYVVSDKIQNT